MKNLLLAAVIVSMAGCAVAIPEPSKNVIWYAPVQIAPTVQIVYYWDPLQLRYFWVDKRDSRHYMEYGWKHPHGHKPRGHDHWDKK